MKNKSKRWTFIVIENNRQLGSFDITETFIIITLIVLLSFASIVVTAFLLHDIKQDLAREDLSQRLKDSQILLAAAHQKKSQLATNIQIIENRLADTTGETGNTVEEAPPAMPKEPVIDDAEGKNEPLPIEAESVDLSRFTVNRGDDHSLSYSFRVNNIIKGNNPVSGYVFAILKSDSPEESLWISDPKATLVEGIPRNFKEGEHFSIYRYKTTKGSFKNISNMKCFTMITVFVFSDTGELILKRDYKIE
jgi:hypothetical protein